MTEILILGAGYAGMTAATALAARTRKRDDVRITLVNPQTRFTERLRLHQTAAGEEVADFQIPDMIEGMGVEFVQGWVTAIDAAAQTVLVDGARTLRYDTLVYALGSVADTESVPGVADHAHTLYNLAEARQLASRLHRLEAGAHVVVCGTGLTGVESSAELADRYPGLRVTLLGRAEPGAALSEKARTYLQDGLARLGVTVRTGVEVAKVGPDTVEFVGGDYLPADVVLWTAGVRVSPLAEQAGLTVDDRGRIITDTVLRSVSHPNVYAIGDAAAVRQNYGVIHGTCQSGMPTGAHVALSIALDLKGKQPKPFRFGYFHLPISLGRGDAVVQFTRPDDSANRFVLTGKRAVSYKEAVNAAPWDVFTRVKKYGAVASAVWRKGGRSTRIEAA
ncbi:NAD(P)/FAD-dependent oxidoreductase [Nocardia lijiangensis]|uniref:NAD(P)/FAD-dependent oxidoreductase n=1 Tax=Nocardia lijiangensis TaxID=299618 RepID=UPI000832D609|nr:FAD-dependent oxidoreductase [Nocardia lijiangensis]